MTTIAPTPQTEATIRNWITTSLHEHLTDLDVIQSLTFNFPSGHGSASSSGIRSINSITLNELKLLSLSYSKVVAILDLTTKVSVNVSWEDYLASQEVRDLIGESEEFLTTNIDTDAELTVEIEFQLISEPPLVASHKFLSIEGDHGSYSYK